MTEDILNLLQTALDKDLLNRDIHNFDESTYNLFVNTIINTVTTVAELNVNTILYEFTESSIVIRCKFTEIYKILDLVLYIEINNNKIINVEASILL